MLDQKNAHFLFLIDKKCFKKPFTGKNYPFCSIVEAAT